MVKETLNIQFLGGAGTVTGSKILLEIEGKRILVDCGLFQGLKELRLKNRLPLPIPPDTIDAVILTHAHLDHSGYIPVLVKNGFKGEIHCTTPTKELTEIILKDSGKIQEEDAERANRHHYTKHKKAKPLYTQKEAEMAMFQFVSHELNEWVIINNHFKFQFLNSGHILGSGLVDLKVNGKRLIFSGDLGRKDPMLLYPPKKIQNADYIILESTYGDKVHSDVDEKIQLLSIIESTFKKKGILMIPSFAVERTQEIIYLIHQLRKEGKLPNIPVYLDSPMGINSSSVYDKYSQWQDLSKKDVDQMYDAVKFINDAEQSRAVVADKKTKIVIAGSGMISGGRILHYMYNHAGNKNNTLLFVGFQATGTRGRSILRGAKEIKYFGEYHPVKCEIKSISSMSGHADQEEIIGWLKNLKNQPKEIFLNHGEPHQANELRVRIKKELGWECAIPQLNDKFNITL